MGWNTMCWKVCSYKRATIAVCCMNLVAALYVLGSLYASPGNGPSLLFSEFKHSDDRISKMEELLRIRRAFEPIDLVKVVKRLKEESSRDKKNWVLSQSLKQHLGDEILQRLKSADAAANRTKQRETLELWRLEKMEEVKLAIIGNSTSSGKRMEEEKMLLDALESDWLTLSEDIGLWIPMEVFNKENNDKPENVDEYDEEEIIPGQPMPSECHAEPHTDYGGAAVRWGLSHHKESAADCCQACFDQAKYAKQGEMKCNIWVYCPSEFGCHSPDKYEHKHQECWLKQDEKPQLNFKDNYSESYRSSHPNAPEVVAWISGVIGP